MDKSVSQEDTQLARKLAAGLLGLPPDREDLITIEKMDFRKSKPLTMADLFVPPNLWSLVWVVLVALLALFAIAVFLAPLSRSARAFVEAFSARNAAEAAAGSSGERADRREDEARETAAKAVVETPAAQSVDGRKPPFWFLTPGHLQSLTFIMKGRPVEDLTILLSYAPGDLASKLSEALYPRSAEALAALPKVTLMPEARIRALEAEILSSLDYVVGGEDKAVNILSGLDETVQEKALAAFSQLDPALAKKMNSSIVRLSALQDLEPAHAQALARRVPMRVLAAALKSSAYTAAFTSKLGGGMQERFQQELDLTRDLPADAYKADRAKVVEAIRQLLKEGLISLKPQGAAPAVPPAAAGPVPAPGAPATAPAKAEAPKAAAPAKPEAAKIHEPAPDKTAPAKTAGLPPLPAAGLPPPPVAGLPGLPPPPSAKPAPHADGKQPQPAAKP